MESAEGQLATQRPTNLVGVRVDVDLEQERCRNHVVVAVCRLVLRLRLRDLVEMALEEVQADRDEIGERSLQLGLEKLIWSRPLKYDGARFVIIGEIDDYQGLSLPVRKTFAVKDGGKYRLVRWLDEKTFFYTTAFAFTSEQADTLTPIALTKARTAMIVRVVYKEPVARKWPGFYFYGSEKPFEFGFVCEEMLSTVPTIEAPPLQKSAGGNRKADRAPAAAKRRARGSSETSFGEL